MCFPTSHLDVWIAPPSGIVIINDDGSVVLQLHAGFGGLIRDATG